MTREKLYEAKNMNNDIKQAILATATAENYPNKFYLVENLSEEAWKGHQQLIKSYKKIIKL